MTGILLVNSVVASERRGEAQAARRRSGRAEPYVNYLAAPQPQRSGTSAFFARWWGKHPERRAPVDFIAALTSS